MNNFALEIWDDESSRVTFYTVRQEDAEFTEMEKFIQKFEGHPRLGQQLEEIIALLLDVMGERRGALPDYFNRPERAASALPPKPGTAIEIGFNNLHFPLRLFCLRVSDEIVVLFNGGEKTSERTQDSPDLSVKINEADSFASRILDELGLSIEINETGRYIIDKDGSFNNFTL